MLFLRSHGIQLCLKMCLLVVSSSSHEYYQFHSNCRLMLPVSAVC